VSGAVRDQVGGLQIGLIGIAHFRQQNSSNAKQKCGNRRGISNPGEKGNQAAICAFFFHHAARKAKLEDPLPQGVGGFRALPDIAGQIGFDFQRGNRRNPRSLAYQKGTLAEKKNA